MKVGTRRAALAVAAIVMTSVVVVARDGDGAVVDVVIPGGATLPDVAHILEDRDVVGSARLFQLYARVRRADRKLQAGSYRLTTRSSMRSVLRRLTRGEVVTVAMTVPEGFSIRQMAERIAEVTGTPATSVLASLDGTSLHAEYSVPGPGLEGVSRRLRSVPCASGREAAEPA